MGWVYRYEVSQCTVVTDSLQTSRRSDQEERLVARREEEIRIAKLVEDMGRVGRQRAEAPVGGAEDMQVDDQRKRKQREGVASSSGEGTRVQRVGEEWGRGLEVGMGVVKTGLCSKCKRGGVETRSHMVSNSGRGGVEHNVGMKAYCKDCWMGWANSQETMRKSLEENEAQTRAMQLETDNQTATASRN